MIGKGLTGWRYSIVAATVMLAAACGNKPPDNPEQYAAETIDARR